MISSWPERNDPQSGIKNEHNGNRGFARTFGCFARFSLSFILLLLSDFFKRVN